ncbi:MAG: aminomethyltransferase [Thiotrichales bacterium]|nr:aminomethyltransferase [Thiotrichales bacterium]
MSEDIVPASRGKAVRLRAGQTLTCTNTYGTQVIDMWAFDVDDPQDWMSMHHTHSRVQRLVPRTGEAFYTYSRRAILTVVEDHSPGVHDSTYPACDKYRYALEGVTGYHRSCGDNLAEALAELGHEAPRFTPQPFNLWMNCPVGADGRIGFDAPVTKPGDYMVLRAEIDCVVAMSACPYDLDTIPVNVGGTPRDVHIAIDAI